MIGSKNILGVSYESWKRCCSFTCDFQVNVVRVIGLQELPRESTVECLGIFLGVGEVGKSFIKHSFY